MKGLGIALWTIIFVVDAMLLRPLVSGVISEAIVAAGALGVCLILWDRHISDGTCCKDGQSHDHDIGALLSFARS